MRRGVGLLWAVAAPLWAGWGCALIAGLEEPPPVQAGTTSSSGGAGPGTGGAGGAGGDGAGGTGAGGTGAGGSGGAGGCLPDTPSVIASAAWRPRAIAVDEQAIFFTTVQQDGGPEEHNAIWRMAKPCGVPEQIASTGVRRPEAITVDDIDVYWSESGEENGLSCVPPMTPPDPANRDRVMRLPQGASADPTATGEFVYSMCGVANALAVNAARVYWARRSGWAQSVNKLTLGGYQGHMTSSAGQPQGIAAADDGEVYWTVGGLDAIYWATTALPSGVAYLSGTTMPGHIALDAQGIYWTHGSSLSTAPRSTAGASPTATATGLAGVTGIAVDDHPTDSAVYAASEGLGAVVRLPKLSLDAPETIADQQTELGGLAIDDTHVYWVRPDTREIWRAPR